jgi:hypothetical protein
MPQIKLPLIAICIAAGLTLSGCGDKNSKTLIASDSKGNHQADWVLTHKTTALANLDSCVSCHGASYTGGISKVSCMSPSPVNGFNCHANSAADFQTGCVSCHGGTPNGPFGVAAPNRKGAHSKHTALTVCATCHLGAGSGTANHAKATATGGLNKATLASSDTIIFNVTLNADGTNKITCSTVSCHGGQVTPEWSTETISIVAGDNTVCFKCHAYGAAQYNSYNSGTFAVSPAPFAVGNLHNYHVVSLGKFCTDCHNIGALTDYTKHFGGIATKTLTAPGNTIGGAPTTITSYTVSTQTCNSVGCHGAGIKTVKWNL